MASNQPNQPTRPWLRLTSLAARTNIPTPTPAPAPALTPQQPQVEAPPPPPAPTTVVVARPTFRPPAPESHPSTEPQPPPTSPLKPVPTSPPKPAAAPSPSPSPSPAIKTTSSPPAATKKPSTSPSTTTTAAANLSRSLKPAAESPPHSRNTPPSPLTLPPPQLKSQDAEQKTVLFQNTKPTSNSHLDGKKEKAHKKPSEETGVRSVITIAGENRGAFMELIKSPRQKRLEGHHLHKKSINGKSLSDNSAGSGEHLQSNSSSSSEEAKRHNHKSVKQAAAPMNAAAAAYMNSNVQGVNNSIVYNSSYTHHDPGVHLAFSKKPSGSTASGGKGN